MSTGTVSGRGRFSSVGAVSGRISVRLTNRPCPACSVCSAVCPSGVTSMVPSQVKKLQLASALQSKSRPVPRMPMVAVAVAKLTLREFELPIRPVSARMDPRSSDTRNLPSAGFLSSKTKLTTENRVFAPRVNRLSSRKTKIPLAAAPMSTVSPT